MVRLPLPSISARHLLLFAACVGIGVILYTTTTMVKLSIRKKVYFGKTFDLTMSSATPQQTRLALTTQSMHTKVPSKVNSSLNKLNSNANKLNFSIAIGLAITSKDAHKGSIQSFLDNLPFFEELLPSFCMTVGGRQHSYHFYIGHDYNDNLFSNQTIQRLCKDEFSTFTKKHCPDDLDVTVHFVPCNHSGRPAWAQNDAMMAAYQDGHDFFYRVNDDTIMITKNWANKFISRLKQMEPPFVGVVGPKHAGGNTGILTYDFVHRTHVDIFGYYYPRKFAWWYADDWITMVYKPRWSVKVNEVRVLHSLSLSRRYKLHTVPRSLVSAVVDKSHLQLERYLGINSTTVNFYNHTTTMFVTKKSIT